MTGALRDALREMVVRHGGRARPEPTSRLSSVVAGLDLPDGSGRNADKNYDEIAARMQQRLAAGGSLSPNEARDAAWCLWGTRTRLTDSDAVLSAYLRQVRSLQRRSPVRSLALSFLYSFAEDRNGLAAIAETLRQLVEVAGKPFDTLHRDFSIFDPARGPQAVAMEAHASRTAPSRVLEHRGLNALSVRAGFAEACAREALKRLAGDTGLDARGRLAFVKEIALDVGGSLYFPKHGPQVANALLLPFAKTQPDEEVCDRYLDLLINLFGDPRSNAGRWVGMPEAADVARSWLTRQALRQFLDVVDAVAPDNMWKHRRTFWEAIYNRKLISAAWVVLDSTGIGEARRRFGSSVQVGRFEKGGGTIQTGHSVLLLKIGRAIVAEWSHSGMCRFWKDGDRKGAPGLYRRSYTADELRWPALYQAEFEARHYPHGGPGAWQHKVARQIFDATGVMVPGHEYL